MGRPKGSINRDKDTNPIEMKLDMSKLKEEKSTEQKTISDLNNDVSGSEDNVEQLIGVGEKTAQKLREKGYCTLTDVATTRADELAVVMGVAYVQAKIWVDDALEKVSSKIKLKTIIETNEEKTNRQIFIKTGSEDFNNLLGGGVPTESITGFSGRFATGKTQVCLDLIVDCIGRLKERAVYIETEPDTVYLSRLKEIANERKISPDWSLLYICESKQIPTMKAQYLQLKVIQKALERGENIRLVVIDSFNARIRAGWGRTEMLPLRTREIAEHVNLIEFLAAKYNIAFVLTCQVIAPPRPDQGLGAKMKYGDTFYAVGGDFLFHSVNNWVGLQQIRTEEWVAVLFDSSHLDRKSCNFILCKGGLMNAIK